MKISCYIITRNEEKRLPRTLDAVKQVADEIIVVDSGSTDNTVEIAKQYTDKVIHRDWISYANQKNFAQNQCTNDWLLSLDADETLSPELISEINELKKDDPKFKAYNMRIGEIFPGFKRVRPFTRVYNIIRLYHKDYATMEPDLLTEDRIAPTRKIKIGQLKSMCNHYAYMNVTHVITKLNKFTDDVVITAQKKNKNYGMLKLALEFPFQFLRYYFWRRYFINGFWGVLVSVNVAYFRWVKVAKFIEAKKIANAEKKQ